VLALPRDLCGTRRSAATSALHQVHVNDIDAVEKVVDVVPVPALGLLEGVVCVGAAVVGAGVVVAIVVVWFVLAGTCHNFNGDHNCANSPSHDSHNTHTCTHIHTDICHKRARTHAPARSDAQAHTHTCKRSHTASTSHRALHIYNIGLWQSQGGNEAKRNALTKYMLPMARTECTL
jgi:hypothetical protein